jgi:hypothetical protein
MLYIFWGPVDDSNVYSPIIDPLVGAKLTP